MDNMIITQTFTMARWQFVVKKSEATNQTKDQNKDQNKNKTNKTKQTNKQNYTKQKTGGGERGVIKQITNRMLS